MESQDQLSDVRILSRAVRGCFTADFLDLVDCVHLCRVKTILNSRVLGYGRLNGHVASIVSMFFKKESFGNEFVPGRYWKVKVNHVPGRY